MAASTGTDVSMGNTMSAWDKLGNLALDFARVKYIDSELPRDGNNIPDQNDLIHRVNTSRDTFGGAVGNTAAGGINPKTLLVGGAILLAGLVALKALKVI